MLLRVLMLVFFLHCLWKHIGSRRVKMRQAGLLYDVVACPDVEMVGRVNSTIRYLGKDDYYVDIDFMYDGDKIKYLRAKLSFSFCPTRALVDCQDMLTFPIDNFCEFITGKENFMTTVLKEVQPPLTSCPVWGNHYVRNFSSTRVLNSTAAFLGIPKFPNDVVYKFDIYIYGNKKTIFCARVSGMMQLIRDYS